MLPLGRKGRTKTVPCPSRLVFPWVPCATSGFSPLLPDHRLALSFQCPKVFMLGTYIALCVGGC